jgi:hypothetical protein
VPRVFAAAVLPAVDRAAARLAAAVFGARLVMRRFFAALFLAALFFPALVVAVLFLAAPVRAGRFDAPPRFCAAFVRAALLPRALRAVRAAPGVRAREAGRAVLRFAMTRPLSGEP